MENEFIPYEQALVLKELGFDEPCLCTYSLNDKKLSRNPSHNMSSELIDEPYTWQNSKIHINNITAPLYQQAFRWFREKYNLFITPYQCWDDVTDKMLKTTKPSFYIIDDFLYNENKSIENSNKYNTYKEAELECLIKLIEICKK